MFVETNGNPSEGTSRFGSLCRGRNEVSPTQVRGCFYNLLPPLLIVGRIESDASSKKLTHELCVRSVTTYLSFFMKYKRIRAVIARRFKKVLKKKVKKIGRAARRPLSYCRADRIRPPQERQHGDEKKSRAMYHRPDPKNEEEKPP